jgi:hypothetical protein
MKQMLQKALVEWKTLSKEERLLPDDPAKQWDRINHPGARFPEDGHGFVVYTRDLKRDRPLPERWRDKFNQDSFWMSAEEAVTILPKTAKTGATRDWPEAITHRLVRLNFLDNVRGQTLAYEAGQIRDASIQTTITDIEKGLVHLSFSGTTRATTARDWPLKDGSVAEPTQSRGIETTVLGTAIWNTKTNAFDAFSLVAAGTRWGATRFNFRENDEAAAPIGFVVTLADDETEARVAPAYFWEYPW